ncbi:2Fe-2S iron-sulfur cluster-binding protein [Novosphingobium colocasiae]|uniref:Ferredoxin n=1 Tax=Novosphingobium colocasiae TaxID=1256513 RepID=A0A918UI17_9SPHN|nr:2Fe-2S iron-sulfur cluster-binding protein [Novosphingobium colocasiae]GGZ13500.1 ferredoxin [Novosphingobium colocasiae]
MLNIEFLSADGTRATVTAQEGARLLEVAQNAGMPLEGTCEGQMACSTCHVLIAPDWFEKLPAASGEEEDMLDLAAGVQRTSRLSCQITLTAALDGMRVKIPAVAHDMQIG